MDSMTDIWIEIKKIIAKDLKQTTLDTWFSDVEVVSLEDCKVVLCTSTTFTRDIIKNRFGDTIKSAFSDLFSCDFELKVLAGEDEKEIYLEKKPIKDSLPEMAGFTFDRFIVGSSNRFAYGAAKAVSEHLGHSDYNPLFIYGNSGLGKTHLLYSIGQHIKETDSTKRIAYVKGDEFTNRLVESLQNRTMNEFRQEFRNVDLLLVDDIQFIAGKESTQEEFFNTFNSIYEAGHQIVITSDRPPKEMATLEDRLRSRFEGGMIADIQPPDFETRIVIIRNKAAQLGLMISDEATDYIANNIVANVRQMEGVIKKLTAYKEILNENITTDSVKRAIEDVIKLGTDIPTPEKIIKETARYYNLTDDEVKGQSRSKGPTEARQIAMYLMRSLTNLSLNEIGKHFENRNHATVLSSIKKIEDMMTEDISMSSKIRDISSNINST